MATSGDFVSYDTRAALDAAHEAAGEQLLICVAYDGHEFNIIYVDDRVEDLYGESDEMESHFGQIHSYVNMDFAERNLFEDLFIQPGGVRAFVTYMGSLTAVRILFEDEGLFIGLAPDAPVSETVDAVERSLT